MMPAHRASATAAAADAAPAGRPWALALLLLAGMGTLFFSSYGLANWLASLRTDVPYFHL